MTGPLLLLAGTAEARALAHALAAIPGLPAVASLAGAVRAPAELPLPTRVGGFGGDAGFAAWLSAHRPRAVVDATHPFAARIGSRTAALCAARGVPYLRVLRPPWHPEPGDDWTELEAEEDAARVIPHGARVFLATGGQRLDRFAGLAGRHVVWRGIDPREGCPIPGAVFVPGRPPFAAAAERALMSGHRIDWLVTRNAGGDLGRAKLAAARSLGVRVAMIARPPAPDAPTVTTVAGALDRIREAAWTNAS
jgi:precorrin-6A/cobalt-precorrin-6A reductase